MFNGVIIYLSNILQKTAVLSNKKLFVLHDAEVHTSLILLINFDE